jgi:hypothetical protein
MNTGQFLRTYRIALSGMLSLAAACDGVGSGPTGAGPPASIRIETRTPTTLPDSDMVVMRASVLDASGTILPNAVVVWKSLDPYTIEISASGQIRGHDNPFTLAREAKIVASVGSDSTIRDTTTAFTMRYAQGVNLAPNNPASKLFGTIALLEPSETQQERATGYIIRVVDSRVPLYSYDSLSTDQGKSWLSRSPEVATVDANGLVTGRSAGSATIVVITRGSAKTDSAQVVVGRAKLRLASVVPGESICGLSPAGAAYCWGTYSSYAANPRVAMTVGSRVPDAPVAGAPALMSLANGYGLACGIGTDALTYCWSVAGTSLAGFPVTPGTAAVVGPDLRFTSVQVGHGHTCALTAGGLAYCWGSNASGELGDGTTTSRSTPAPVAGGVQFASITAGEGLTCGIAIGGEAYCWGFGEQGGVGNGTATTSLVPTLVLTDQRFVQIRAGGSVCGRTATGQAYCWGLNYGGGVGDGTTTNRTSPVLVGGGNVFASITVGGGSACGLTPDGRALCWGSNVYGQLGDGSFIDRITPTPVSGGLSFSTLTTKYLRTCGFADGVYYCWGENRGGTLGTNVMQNVNVPTKLAGIIP